MISSGKKDNGIKGVSIEGASVEGNPLQRHERKKATGILAKSAKPSVFQPGSDKKHTNKIIKEEVDTVLFTLDKSHQTQTSGKSRPDTLWSPSKKSNSHKLWIQKFHKSLGMLLNEVIGQATAQRILPHTPKNIIRIKKKDDPHHPKEMLSRINHSVSVNLSDLLIGKKKGEVTDEQVMHFFKQNQPYLVQAMTVDYILQNKDAKLENYIQYTSGSGKVICGIDKEYAFGVDLHHKFSERQMVAKKDLFNSNYLEKVISDPIILVNFLQDFNKDYIAKRNDWDSEWIQKRLKLIHTQLTELVSKNTLTIKDVIWRFARLDVDKDLVPVLDQLSVILYPYERNNFYNTYTAIFNKITDECKSVSKMKEASFEEKELLKEQAVHNIINNHTKEFIEGNQQAITASIKRKESKEGIRSFIAEQVHSFLTEEKNKLLDIRYLVLEIVDELKKYDQKLDGEVIPLINRIQNIFNNQLEASLSTQLNQFLDSESKKAVGGVIWENVVKGKDNPNQNIPNQPVKRLPRGDTSWISKKDIEQKNKPTEPSLKMKLRLDGSWISNKI